MDLVNYCDIDDFSVPFETSVSTAAQTGTYLSDICVLILSLI